MAPCPEPAVLDAFVCGTLAADSRASLEDHLDVCPDCASVVAEVARLYGSASWPSHPRGDDPTPRAEADPPTASTPPLEVGRYRLGRRIGAGGMGLVFEAFDPELHRHVAIKLLHPGVAGDAEPTRARLLREARAMARLAHPNVVAVHDVGRVGDQVFLAMELVDGTTLSEWLKERPRSLRQILAAFVQAGRGLEAAHAVGLVHRDFKPDNVLVGRDDRIRVTDFGLARPSLPWTTLGAPAVVESSAPKVTLGSTEQGTIVGTPAYMAPEQWQGTPADARSDQFAFCVALYEALFSRRPFAGADVSALAEAVIAGRAHPPPRSAPTWLRAALTRGLAVDPEARHASMTILLAALERDRGRLRRAGAIGAAMGLGVATTVGVLTWVAEVSHRSADADSRAACARDGAAIGDIWNDGARERVRAALAATQAPIAAEAATSLIAEVDEQVEAWSAARTQVCIDGIEASGRDAERVLARRLACLEERRLEIGALVDLALASDAMTIHRTVVAAHILSPVTACEDPAGFDLEEEALAEVAAVRGRLAAVRLETMASSFDRAEEILAEAERRATETGWAPLEARVRFEKGALARARGDIEGAAQHFAAAFTMAGTADAHATAAQAATSLASLEAFERRHVDVARHWADMARMMLARGEDDDVIGRANLLRAQGEIEDAAGNYAQALASYEEARALFEGELGSHHPSIASMLNAIGNAQSSLGRHSDAEAAYREAGEIWKGAYGAEHPDHATALTNIADMRRAAGDHEGARALFVRALSILERTYGPDHPRLAVTLNGIGAVEAALENPKAAAAAFERVRDLFESAHGRHHHGVATALNNLAAVHMMRGDSAAALAATRESLEIREATLPPDHPEIVQSLLNLSTILHERGEAAAAVPHLRRALAIVDDMDPSAPRRAERRAQIHELLADSP